MDLREKLRLVHRIRNIRLSWAKKLGLSHVTKFVARGVANFLELNREALQGYPQQGENPLVV